MRKEPNKQPIGYEIVPVEKELPTVSGMYCFIYKELPCAIIFNPDSEYDVREAKEKFSAWLRPVFTPESTDAEEEAEIDPTNESMGMNAARHWKKKHDDLLASRNGYTKQQVETALRYGMGYGCGCTGGDTGEVDEEKGIAQFWKTYGWLPEYQVGRDEPPHVTLEQIMDEVAISKGYASWKEMYNWIAREGQLPLVVAQLIEAAMKEVVKRYAASQLPSPQYGYSRGQVVDAMKATLMHIEDFAGVDEYVGKLVPEYGPAPAGNPNHICEAEIKLWISDLEDDVQFYGPDYEGELHHSIVSQNYNTAVKRLEILKKLVDLSPLGEAETEMRLRDLVATLIENSDYINEISNGKTGALELADKIIREVRLSPSGTVPLKEDLEIAQAELAISEGLHDIMEKKWIEKMKEMVPLKEYQELAQVLNKLANESMSFLNMADVHQHGTTNMEVLRDRISTAFNAITAAESLINNK